MKKIIIFLLIFFQQFVFAQTYFQKIITGEISTTPGSHSMAGWGDYNNDGFQDLVVTPWNDGCWNCRTPIIFYYNNGNGDFITGRSVISDAVLSCIGIAWGDYDNNGWLDVFVTRYFNQKNLLFHNDSIDFDQVITGSIATDIASSTGCSWGDYDKDGWLDLFVSRGQNQNNALYHNNGNGTFTKITSGEIVNDGGESRGCSWGDYDNDGWIDLFVVNYGNQNSFFYKNNGNGTFTKRTDILPVLTQGYGSGCSWGDYDNDGWLDLIVTYNAANSLLYHNERNGNFSITSLAPSQEWGWSYYPAWADIDNDGWLDLFIPKRTQNGFTGINALFKNNSGTSFTKITTDIAGQEGGASDAGVFGDYNNDGKVDLFVSNGSVGSPVNNYLYKNITSNSNNFITLKIKGCTLNKSAIGARVKLVCGNLRQTREISGSSGSQSMLWQHFGIGNAAAIDSIIVSWTTGETKVLTNVSPNQILTVTECPLVGIINNQIPERFELKQNYPNPFNPVTKIEYSIQMSADVKLSVYDVSGKHVNTLINEFQYPGTYSIDFAGTGLASGTYFYRIEAGDFKDIKKMVLLK